MHKIDMENLNTGNLLKPIEETDEYPLELETRLHNGGYMTTIMTDEETGVEYIVVNLGNSIAITPRYTNRGQD